ncbi:MAG: tripartite tricarboxylate transporter TctB family protein [Burkholderiaceae bacterium]|nr:tripartite tricarboxylate transporter TctB family protein [Burkholderiaceae bacterium]MDO9088560.1 tripartite tricarboxylate transporter TctB family protein [Burkholderiaceae bacterium]
MRIKSSKDFWSGIMFGVMGLGFAVGATSYNVGEGARMGPGYFPLMLGAILAIMGGVILVKALVVETVDGDKIGRWAWRPLCYVLGSNLAFGVLLGGLPSIKLPAMGMVVAIYALVIIAGRAGDNFKLREMLILSTVLAIGSYLAFIVLLKLQIPVWPTFITG